jgi:hypothetical protein
MQGRRIWLRVSVCVLLLLLLLGTAAWLGTSRWLAQQQIEDLHWQGFRVSSAGLGLQQLSFTHPTASVQLQDLLIEWPDFNRPAPWVRRIKLQQLSLSLAQSSAVAETPPMALNVAQTAGYVSLIPAHLQIAQLNIDLPCAEQRCTLSGALNATNTSRYLPDLNLDLSVQLTLQHGNDELEWKARLLGVYVAPHLQVDLAINQQPQMLLLTSLEPKPDGQFWHMLVNADIQQAATLHSWLRQWLPTSAQLIAQAPKSAQIESQFSLLLPNGPIAWASLQQASGTLSAYANLPQPWPIPALGQIQGQLDITARAVDGQWLADSLSSNLTLSQITSELSQSLPAGLQPDAVQIKLQPVQAPTQIAEPLLGRELPVSAQIMVQGKSPLVLDGTLILSNSLPWAVQLVDTTLTASTPAVDFQDLNLKGLKATLKLDGYVDQKQYHMALANASKLSAERLRYGQWQAEQVDASGSDLTLQGQIPSVGPITWQARSTLALTAKPLHEQLKPQRWSWRGPVTLDNQAFELSGTLSNDAQLSAKVGLQHSLTKGLSLNAQFNEMFLRTGNPLQGSFTTWPALLELNNGRLKGTAQLHLKPAQNSPNITLNFSAKGLSGIYDRTQITGLSGNPSLQINASTLQLELPDLTLEQANPGVPLGPLQLRGHYQAALKAPDKGTLKLTQARSALIGGELTLPANQWDLASSPLLFPFELKGLQLEQLFTLYPTEGLAGTGSIDGRLPLQLSSAGFSIEQGFLEARQPGGRLQFDSERIRQLGRSNPAMQLVTQSLEDFQFSTLNSQVNYDPQGQLTLGIRLEGQNPEIEKGRPIHFNINLQEDIPTLLASLQLSDKVSEIIQQRVQQHLLQRDAENKPKTAAPE